MSSLTRNGLGFGVASVLAGAAAMALLHGPQQLGALLGLGAGVVSGGISLGFVARSAQKSTQAALLAVVSGFLIRMVLVGLALVLSKVLHAEAIACAVGFFVLYVVGQALEIAVVTARSQAQEHGA